MDTQEFRDWLETMILEGDHALDDNQMISIQPQTESLAIRMTEGQLFFAEIKKVTKRYLNLTDRKGTLIIEYIYIGQVGDPKNGEIYWLYEDDTPVPPNMIPIEDY